MRRFVATASLAFFILFTLYAAKIFSIRTRLQKERTRLLRNLQSFQDQSTNTAKVYFELSDLQKEAGKKLSNFEKTHPGFYPTSYAQDGVSKGANRFPPLPSITHLQGSKLSKKSPFWLAKRWGIENGKLWLEVLRYQKWPSSNVPLERAPVIGLTSFVPKEIVRPEDPKIELALNQKFRGLRALTSSSINLGDSLSDLPVTLACKIGFWTHFILIAVAWLFVMAFLRILRYQPSKSGKRELQLQEELAYLSKTYQNLSKSLRAERQKVEAILNSAPDGIFTCTPDGIITFWNRSMEALTNLSKEIAVGKHYHDTLNIFSAGGQVLADPFSVSFIQEKKLNLLDCQIGVLDPNDSSVTILVIPVALGAARVNPIDGLIDEIVVTVKDIRLQKEAEQLRADMHAMITHDLRSPLSAMLGYAGLIQNDKITKTEDDVQKYLDSLVRAGKEMMILISNLLGWTWIEEGKFGFHKEPLAVSPILKETAENFGVLGKPKNLAIAVGAPADLFVFTDGDKLKEILNNLLTNAIKFSRSGGTIYLDAREEGDKVRISVKDEGIGIPPEEREGLFEKFSSLRKPGSGTGLGLYIVKTLAEALDGSVEVETEPGVGSTFTIMLPAVQKVTTRAQQLSLLSLVPKEELNSVKT